MVPAINMDPLIVFQPAGRQGRLPAGTSLLEAARQLGVDIDSICGGRQTCGKCRVIVEHGEFAKYDISSDMAALGPPQADEVNWFARHPGKAATHARLSCAAFILGDCVISVPPESQQHKQVIGKDARHRPVALAPALRQVQVEVAPHALGERDGDFERLQQALTREWQIAAGSISLHALRQLTHALKQGKQRVTVTLQALDGTPAVVLDVRPGFAEAMFGIAVDVGSTTIAVHLCNLHTGDIAATSSAMNPQVSYGEDLMSRISYVMMNGESGLARLHDSVINTLNTLCKQACDVASIPLGDVYEIVIVGNTVMHHLLLGIDPTELGAAPFTLSTHGPLNISARELGLNLHPAANVHLPALEAGHVGSDNLGVLVSEAPEAQDAMTLLIDVGTNAEIVLGNRAALWSCSSPTGPAFEGGQITHGQRAAPGAIERVRIDRATHAVRFKVIGRDAWSDEPGDALLRATGICGSGIIEAVAELFSAGLLRPDGRLGADGAAVMIATAAQSATGAPIVITQVDVRNIQLAKAALHAGCKLLMRRAGVTQVDRIVLAGAFGSYINPMHAMLLGLIPDCALDQVSAVGNAAGDGARIMLLNQQRRAESARLARDVHYIETAIDPHFQEEFVAAMHLPHKTDPYPALAALGVLPDVPHELALDARAARRERRARSTT